MQIVSLILCIFIIISFINRGYAFAIYLAIRLLVPVIARVPYVNTSLNSACLLVLIGVSVLKGDINLKQLLNLKEVKFAVLCCIPLLISMLFGIIPINFQISEFIKFLYTEVLPAIVGLAILKRKSDLTKVNNILIASAIISCIYGFITFITLSNPVYDYFQAVFKGQDETIIDISEKTKGAIIGGTVSMAFGGGLIWSQMSLVLLGYFWSIRKNINKILFIILNVLLFLNSFLSGHRASIIGIIIIYIYFAFHYLKARNALKYFVIGFVSMIVIYNSPFIEKYKVNINSIIFFWDEEVGQEIKGSSVSLRASQLNATLQSLIRDPLGKGYGYPQYRSKDWGIDPVMFGYESIFFRTSWESGIIGVCIWLLFFYRFREYIKLKSNPDSAMLYWGYIISILMTAIQSTFFLFAVSGILIQKRLLAKERAIKSKLQSNSIQNT